MVKFWNNLNLWQKIGIIVIFILVVVVIIGIILYIIFHKKDSKEKFTESDEYVGNNVIWSFCKAWRDGILGIVNKKN